jgi:putative acetyltransferase
LEGTFDKMLSKIEIRAVELSDLEEIFQVFQKAITVSAKSFYTPEQIRVWADAVSWNRESWIERLQKERFIVAIDRSKIVGFASLKGLNYFDLLFVDPNFGRKGIAGMMYDRLEKLIPSGTKISTHPSKLSFNFFLKKGFKLVSNNEVELQGVKFPHPLLEKEIH